jgi:hypothetical protein
MTKMLFPVWISVPIISGMMALPVVSHFEDDGRKVFDTCLNAIFTGVVLSLIVWAFSGGDGAYMMAAASGGVIGSILRPITILDRQTFKSRRG